VVERVRLAREPRPPDARGSAVHVESPGERGAQGPGRLACLQQDHGRLAGEFLGQPVRVDQGVQHAGRRGDRHDGQRARAREQRLAREQLCLVGAEPGPGAVGRHRGGDGRRGAATVDPDRARGPSVLSVPADAGQARSGTGSVGSVSAHRGSFVRFAAVRSPRTPRLSKAGQSQCTMLAVVPDARTTESR
jgi:hypothetical protein